MEDIATDYMNTRQAAEYMGVSERTIRNYCKERKVQFFRPSQRVILFKQEWLDVFITSATTKPETDNL